MLPEQVDLVVVGAGTAGAAAAGFAAGHGFKVLCVDRRRLDGAGARWVNGITQTALAEANLTDVAGSMGAPPPFHLLTPHQRVVVPKHDVLEVDMRALVAQLHDRARDAGAILVGGVAVRGRDGTTLRTEDGDVRARWIVDASGLAGVGLLEYATVAPEHLCAAAQAVFELRDRGGAEAYFASQRVPFGEICAHVGVSGGYSVLNLHVHHGGQTVGVLTGAIPALGFRSGKAILDDFVRAQPWIGARIFGGSGAIPLRRSRDRLTDGTVALVGDAACQVFPAHGSGIGAGILAGKLVADTLAGGGTLFDYEAAWQRRWGGLFATYDAVRRWSQTLDGAALDEIFERGLVDVESARAGLDQELPRISALGLRQKVRTLAANRGWARSLADLAARAVAVQALYARYPRNPVARAAWSAAVQRILPV